MGTQADKGGSNTGPLRRTWYSQLVPGTYLGYALAALSVLIVGVGVYVASGLVRDLVRSGSAGPGAAQIGETTDLGRAAGEANAVQDLFRSRAPGVGSEELNRTRTASGARVVLEYAYVDANSVVVGYTVEDLEEGRRLGGHPVELQPGYANGIRLTNEGGTGFRLSDSGGEVSPGPNNILEGPQANVAVFEADGRIEAGREHRFRLEVPIVEVPVTSLTSEEETPEPRLVGEPFFIGFEVPVRPAPVVEVDQKDTASGTTLTLERVTDSPGQPEAVVCLLSSDEVRGWIPAGGNLGSVAPQPVAGEGACLEVLLEDPLNGPSSVTVADIEKDGEVIRGPWRFDFDMPGP